MYVCTLYWDFTLFRDFSMGRFVLESVRSKNLRCLHYTLDHLWREMRIRWMGPTPLKKVAGSGCGFWNHPVDLKPQLDSWKKKQRNTKIPRLHFLISTWKKNLPYLFSDTMMFPKHWFLGKKKPVVSILMVDKAFIDFIGSFEGSVFNNQGFTAFQSCRHGFISFTAVHVPVTFFGHCFSLWANPLDALAQKDGIKLHFVTMVSWWTDACMYVDRLDD